MVSFPDHHGPPKFNQDLAILAVAARVNFDDPEVRPRPRLPNFENFAFGLKRVYRKERTWQTVARGAVALASAAAHLHPPLDSPWVNIQDLTGLRAAAIDAECQGRGAFAGDGQMVDEAIVWRAPAILRDAGA